MTVNREPILWWFENCVYGRDFRRKNGKVVYHAESLEIDNSYEQHYGFVTVFVKLRDLRNSRALTVEEAELRTGFVEVQP